MSEYYNFRALYSPSIKYKSSKVSRHGRSIDTEYVQKDISSLDSTEWGKTFIAESTPMRTTQNSTKRNVKMQNFPEGSVIPSMTLDNEEKGGIY